MYRLKVVKTFLRVAVPLSKVDAFRDLLEENSFRLTDHCHMCDLIPFIITQEMAESWASQCLWCLMAPQSLERQWLLLLDYSFAITQRLICLQLLTKSMTREEIVREHSLPNMA